MKNIFRILMAVAVLLTASCAKEDISSSIGGGEVEMTFTVDLQDLGSRAYGDGAQVNTLRFSVYDAVSGEKLTQLCGQKAPISASTPTTVNLVLLKGMKYNITFWADHDAMYNFDGQVVTVDYDNIVANDEERDAFYAYVKEFDPAVATSEDTVIELYRPFAQLNAISTDAADALTNSGVTISKSTVKAELYNSFNLTDGTVSNLAEKTLTAGDILSAELLSMNYLFAPAEGYTPNVTFTFENNKGIDFGASFSYVPLKRNYRTNIIGSLLTKPTDFTVEIEADFNQPDKDVVQTAAELQQQIENAPDGEETEIVLGGDIDLNDLLGSLGTLSTRAAATPSLTIPAGKNIVLNLNGCTLSATEDSTGSYALITNKGTLTISDSKGTGMMQLTATVDREWNAYSSVISNTVGGVLTVNGGTIEHLGGTDMAYGIDNLTNGKGTSAVATINGGTVKSTYRAIRQFLNGVEANNSLTINGGTIEGANKSVWMQDPSKNANTGTLVISEDASLIGNVYLSVTSGSTEWPVNVSIAKAALKDGSEVLTNNVPAGYEVAEENGVWTVNFVPVAKIGDKEYGTLGAAVAAVQDGETITFVADIEQVDGVIITDKNLTIDLNSKTFTVSEGASTNNRNLKINGSSVVTIKNGTMVAAGEYSSGAYGTIRTEDTANVTLEGVKLYNDRGNGLNVKALSGTTVTINNTEIYSQYGGGVEAAGGNVVLNNVTIDQKGMYTAPYNSMTISVNGGGVATVNSGTYSTVCLTAEEANNQGTSHGPWCAGVLNSGGKLIIKGGTFANDNFGDNALATYARGLLLADTGANIQINGGTFNALKAIVDVTNNLGDASRNPSVALAGGDFSADPRISGLYASNLISVAEGYEVTEENGRWILNFRPAAKIGETTYNTLQEAIEAVQEGVTIELNRDITLTETLVILANKNFTLDLNGKTLAHSDAENKYAINNLGILTIKGNGVVNARGIYNGYGNGGDNVASAKLIVENGTFNAKGTNGGACIFNYGIVEITGGKFESNGGYGLNNQPAGVLSVANAEVNGGIYNQGNVTIENSTVYQHLNGKHAIYNWQGNVTINSGNFDSQSGNELILADGQDASVVINGGTFNKTAKSWLFGAATGKNISFVINGGTHNGYVNKPEMSVDTIRPYGDPIVVTGGTFNFNPTNWLATGYKAIENNDETYSVVAE